ncbi:MAG: Calx-beta domain-containing protein [Pseudomonadota bacterium]
MTTSLHDLVDKFLNGDAAPEVFANQLTAYCDATPDSAWEVLALLDQYHRRGKLSGEHLRTLRRKIEFHALGIPEPRVAAAPVLAAPDAEVVRLRTALEMERGKSRRYRHRIETLAEYARQHRNSSSPAMKVAKVPMRAKVHAGSVLLSLWLAQHRRLQRPHTWSSAALLVAAATVITGSSSNLVQLPDAPVVATTPVILEAAPQLPAAALEPQTISLSSSRVVVLPGKSTATIQVERSGEIGEVARFKWWTQSAGAKSGKDYQGQSQVAQFEAGETSVQLPVRILANPQRKHTEMFYVAIGKADTEAIVEPNSKAAVFIMRAN